MKERPSVEPWMQRKLRAELRKQFPELKEEKYNVFQHRNVKKSQRKNKQLHMQSKLLTVLGENAPSKILTAHKTEFVAQRDNGVVTGFVITNPNGDVAIIDKSAVRWLSKDEWWGLFHPLNRQ